MEYFAVPYCSGETHTMYFLKDDLMEASPDQENITEEQVKHIYKSEKVEMNPNWDLDMHIANIMNWEVVVNDVPMNDFLYFFDKIAIISADRINEVQAMVDVAWESNGSDSALSNAADMFHKFCKAIAIKTIDITQKYEVTEL